MKNLFFLLLLLFSFSGTAQQKFTISGHIKEKSSGEGLIGATVYVKQLQKGTSSNQYGFYSLSLEEGDYTLVFSFMGYQSMEKNVVLSADRKLEIELSETSAVLETVTVTADRPEENVQSVEMSVERMPMKLVRKMPAFMGEVDVIKTLQYLPGISSGGEGNSGIYVRGGGPGQNLILLDEAPVYNASHLLGFFSVFNSDVVKDMKIYKGGIPAQYGGRLSSLIDIRMKEGNNRKFSGGGGLGLLSSRLSLEIPVVKERASLIVAGRRTYADLFLKLHPDKQYNQNTLYFYDLNAKFNYRVSENDRIFLSGYFGRDVFEFGDEFGFEWGNYTTTFRWNHLFNPKLFSNLTLLFSKYDYNLGVPEGTEGFKWEANLRNFSAKTDFTYYMNPQNTIKFGVSSIYHSIHPGEVTPYSESFFNPTAVYDTHALESAVYVSNEHKIGDKLTLKYGLRYSHFAQIGTGVVYEYEDPSFPTEETIRDSTVYKATEHIKTYQGFEPRLAANFLIDENTSLKASYNRTYQYLHLVSNTSSPTPLDVWVPSGKYIKPQIADQVAVGLFKNFLDNSIETSVEVYYKDMQNQIDYIDGANLFLNKHLETEMRRGDALSYGLELMIKKNTGRFTGWLSYTLARTTRKIDGVNNGKEYLSAYDRTHDVSLILSYELDDRWTISGNWVLASGNPATFPIGQMEVEGSSVALYSDRNAYRLPTYHRMDLGATYTPRSSKTKRWKSSWSFSLFNVYAHRNTYSLSFRAKESNPKQTEAIRLSIIGTVVPSVTYNFNF